MLTSLVCNQCEARRAGAPRVLVLDDYPGAAIATATYLSLDGMEARVAGGCGDALETIKKWIPDVVLMDIWMPQRDGFETAEAINIVLRLLVLSYWLTHALINDLLWQIQPAGAWTGTAGKVPVPQTYGYREGVFKGNPRAELLQTLDVALTAA